MATSTALAGGALRMTAAEIAKAVGGTLSGADAPVRGVSTDSRTTAAGNLFVALAGESFDGHGYLAKAAERGAAAALVTRGKIAAPAPLPLVEVEGDTLPALASLARAHRDALRIPVVGITGSAGKTTAKEMTAAVLSGGGRTVLKTEGNLNNRIGVPLTVMSIGPEHGAAVVEMGISLPGEMAELVRAAKPTVRVFLVAGVGHVEFLKDADGVAAEKGHIFDDALAADAMVFNADDPRVAREAAKRPLVRKVSFGRSAGANVRAVKVSSSALGEQVVTMDLAGDVHDVRLKTVGEHMAVNALAAAAVGVALGIPAREIVEGLESRFVPVPGRGDVVKLGGDVVMVDDTYNSNPTSAAAALRAAAAARASGRKRAVAALGDMLELGQAGPDEHAAIGKLAGELKLDALYAFGPLSRRTVEEAARAGVPAKGFDTREALVDALAGELAAGDLLLVKGSRGMKMDLVVAALRDRRRN